MISKRSSFSVLPICRRLPFCVATTCRRYWRRDCGPSERWDEKNDIFNYVRFKMRSLTTVYRFISSRRSAHILSSFSRFSLFFVFFCVLGIDKTPYGRSHTQYWQTQCVASRRWQVVATNPWQSLTCFFLINLSCHGMFVVFPLHALCIRCVFTFFYSCAVAES